MGKGLGALISGMDGQVTSSPAPAPTHNPASICEIPVDKISANPYQPRSNFDEEALSELTESIRQLGIIQPITVRKIGLKYQIISGERRFKAASAAGLKTIPAYIKDTDDQGMLEMAIVENIQRENLDPIEIAMSYQRLIEECSLTQEQMAVRVGKKRASVTNYLRLLKLPAKVQHDLKVGLLSVGHAKVLLGIENEDIQEQLCDLIIKEDLSVRQLEERIKKLEGNGQQKKKAGQDLPEDYFKMLEIFGKYFDNSISLKRTSEGKGTMTIRFSSDDEVKKFLKAIEDSGI